MTARRRLRSGFTTGACAAAAAGGATARLLGSAVDTFSLDLPWGKPEATATPFRLVTPNRGPGWAACGVVKDAGDDPDVTDKAEIRATVYLGAHSGPPPRGAVGPVVRIEGGEGVGRVTKPGLGVAVGGPAINPVPRAMIEAAVRGAVRDSGRSDIAELRIMISVPTGAELARKTLNSRLGILGGISILGTTGIVIPMSADAWRATIDAGLDVARAAGLDRVVLSHGRSSEAAAQSLWTELPEEAFVLMGDHVGHALEAAAGRGLGILLAGQFAKFCKVAAGNFATHVKDSTLDRGVIEELLTAPEFAAADRRRARSANTAREVFQWLLEHGDRGVFDALAQRVAERAAARAGAPVSTLLFGYDKRLLARGEARP